MNVLRAVLLMVVILGSVGYARTWTDATGKFQVEAEFVQVVNAIVHLKRPNGARGAGLDRIGQGEQPSGISINRNPYQCLSFTAQVLRLVVESAELDSKFLHQPAVTYGHRLPVDFTAQTRSG